MRRKTAYVVTSGEYSSYSIDAVYLDPRLAEAHARVEDHRVEEYEISGAPPKTVEVLRIEAHRVLGDPGLAEAEAAHAEWAELKARRVSGQHDADLEAEIEAAKKVKRLREAVVDTAGRTLVGLSAHERVTVELADEQEWPACRDGEAFGAVFKVYGTDHEQVRKVFAEKQAQAQHEIDLGVYR